MPRGPTVTLKKMPLKISIEKVLKNAAERVNLFDEAEKLGRATVRNR